MDAGPVDGNSDAIPLRQLAETMTSKTRLRAGLAPSPRGPALKLTHKKKRDSKNKERKFVPQFSFKHVVEEWVVSGAVPGGRDLGTWICNTGS